MLPIEVVAVLIPKLYPPTLFLMLERNLCDNELFTLIHVKELLSDQNIVNEIFTNWLGDNIITGSRSIADFFREWNQKYLFRDTPLEYVQKQWFSVYNVLLEECLQDACEHGRSDFIRWILKEEELCLQKDRRRILNNKCLDLDLRQYYDIEQDDEITCLPKLLFMQGNFDDPRIRLMMKKKNAEASYLLDQLGSVLEPRQIPLAMNCRIYTYLVKQRSITFKHYLRGAILGGNKDLVFTLESKEEILKECNYLLSHRTICAREKLNVYNLRYQCGYTLVSDADIYYYFKGLRYTMRVCKTRRSTPNDARMYLWMYIKLGTTSDAEPRRILHYFLTTVLTNGSKDCFLIKNYLKYFPQIFEICSPARIYGLLSQHLEYIICDDWTVYTQKGDYEFCPLKLPVNRDLAEGQAEYSTYLKWFSS
jgi:hypothetical protein